MASPCPHGSCHTRAPGLGRACCGAVSTTDLTRARSCTGAKLAGIGRRTRGSSEGADLERSEAGSALFPASGNQQSRVGHARRLTAEICLWFPEMRISYKRQP